MNRLHSPADIDHAGHRAAEVLVPRHVRHLNSLAESCGLSTESRNSEQHLLVDWSGTVDQFIAMSLFTNSQKGHFRYAVKGFRLLLPTSVGRFQKPLLDGLASLSGEPGDPDRPVTVEFDFGEAPQQILERGNIEVRMCANGAWYHGTAEALLEFGALTREKLPLGKRSTKSASYPLRDWVCRRQPDGFFSYWEESELSVRRRQAEKKKWEEEQRERLENLQREREAEAEQRRSQRSPEVERGYAIGMAERMALKFLYDVSDEQLPLLRDLVRLAGERPDAREILERAMSDRLALESIVALLRQPRSRALRLVK